MTHSSEGNVFSCSKFAPATLCFYDFWESSSDLTWKRGSDRVLKGVRRAVRRGPNRTGDGYVRDTVGKFEVGGGFVFFGGGFAKMGVDEPPEPPLVTGLYDIHRR